MTEEGFIEKRQTAMEILFVWIYTATNSSVHPFTYNEDTEFTGIVMNAHSTAMDRAVDMIIYVNELKYHENIYEKYHIYLMNQTHDVPLFENEKQYATYQIGVYYIDIDWILSHKEKVLSGSVLPPIEYIASIDHYNKKDHPIIHCNSCKTDDMFWVERVDVNTCKYKMYYIGCLHCGYNTFAESLKCVRCKTLDTTLVEMETNCKKQYILCKNCDIDLLTETYIHVPSNQSDEIKKWGGLWSRVHNSWYIHNTNKYYDKIVNKWKRIW
jgi:hypothetical protein